MLKAFTIIETFTVIVVFSLIIVAFWGSVFMILRTKSYTWQQSLAIEEARRGIDTMIKEIREAQEGEDGSYPIEKADDKELIFYADVDKDGRIEKVRYFLAGLKTKKLSGECSTNSSGGSCQISFSNFLTGGNLKSAMAKVSVMGDFDSSKEFAEVFADGQGLGRICEKGCHQCFGNWEGTTIFEISTSTLTDNFISFQIQASSKVDVTESCGTYTMRAKVDFFVTEEYPTLMHQLAKGITEPTGTPPTYPFEEEKVTILSSYVRNNPPIFYYYDSNNQLITDYPARLKDTVLMKVYLVINVDPNRPPREFELESFVSLRNLKK